MIDNVKAVVRRLNLFGGTGEDPFKGEEEERKDDTGRVDGNRSLHTFISSLISTESFGCFS